MFVPLSKPKHTHPPWYNKALLTLKNKKSKSLKRYQKSKSVSDYKTYSILRNSFSTCQKKCYKEYVSKTEDELINDPSKFWVYVNTKRKISGLPNNVVYKDKVSSVNFPASAIFAEFFSEVYCDESPANICPPTQNCLLELVQIGFMELTFDEVLRKLLNLNINKGRGPDEIPPSFLVECAQSLVTPLLFIFNLSLASGVFPKRWKTSYISPIFKAGSRNNVENYRGIAILPTLGKMFESLVTDVLTEKLQSSISIYQHGFMKGRSASSNLIEFTNYTSLSIESGYQVDVVYTDFSKAFDRVPHKLLIRKLSNVGIHANMLSWIDSYLTGRSQYVLANGQRSNMFKVLSGVPQGSHLGPLLFLLFINDVTSVFKYSKCLLYADDLKIFTCIKNFSDAINLQHDVDALSDWCIRNCLSLNVNKCKCMTFSRKMNPINFNYMINGTNLEKATSIRDLGVIFDMKLSFNMHIDSKIAKAYAMLGFLKRICVEFTNVHTLRSLYCAIVRSQLEFSSVVWCPYFDIHINRIESIQKQFVLYALRKLNLRDNNFILPPYSERCEMLSLESLRVRRENASVFFIFDLLSGYIDAPNLLSLINIYVPPRVFRNHSFLARTFHSSTYGCNEPMNRMTDQFNTRANLFDFTISRSSFRWMVRSSRP